MPAYEAAIHARWAADETLNGLLPAARFVTGIYFPDDDDDSTPEPEYPYATMTDPGGRRGRDYSNDTILAYPSVQITLYYGKASFDEAKTAIDAVVALFDRVDFDLVGGGTVQKMQMTGEPRWEQDLGDGHWEFTVDFDLDILVEAA